MLLNDSEHIFFKLRGTIIIRDVMCADKMVEHLASLFLSRGSCSYGQFLKYLSGVGIDDFGIEVTRYL